MLTRLDLEHFKCFELLKLPLGRLTLCGANASGKSSVLQSLALLHQTMKDQEWSSRLLLNGSEISLGTVVDVVDKVTGSIRLESESLTKVGTSSGRLERRATGHVHGGFVDSLRGR